MGNLTTIGRAVLRSGLTLAAVLSGPAWSKPGTQAVGVQRLTVTDLTRPQVCAARNCPPGRRIPVLFFYPARAQNGLAATLSTMGQIADARSALAERLRNRNKELLAYAVRKYKLGDEELSAQRLEGASSGAFLNAPAQVQRYPVLVYAGGANFMVQENVTLWSLLAEHGYLVAAIPTIGPRSVDFSADGEGLETLARDMEAVLAHIRVLPQADTQKVGLMGFSYGGAAAMLSAMRQATVAAVVGYDASFISKNYGRFLKAAPQYSPDRFSASLLDIHAKTDETTDEIVSGLRYSQARSIEVPNAEHVDFTHMSQIAFAQFGERSLPLRSLSERAGAHQLIVSETIAFLDHALKGKPVKSIALPPGWSTQERAALALPPTPAELVRVARQKGYDAAFLRLKKVQDSDPAAALASGPALNQYGYSLTGTDPQSALTAFRLNLSAHPDRSEYWDSLADGFLAIKDAACAASAYRSELQVLKGRQTLGDLDRSVQKTAENYLLGAATTPCLVTFP